MKNDGYVLLQDTGSGLRHMPGMPEKQTKTISPGNDFRAFVVGFFSISVLQVPIPVLIPFLIINQNMADRLRTIQNS